MPRACSIAKCRTGYNATLADRASSCRMCTQDSCQCSKFNCVCKSLNCPCSCKVCKPKIFSFPDDEVEKENWKKACPNIFSSDNTKLYACEWHWPDDYDTISPIKGSHICSRRPKNPPSLFENIPVSCSRTSLTRARSSLSSSGQRNIIPDELETFNEFDLFKSMQDLKEFVINNFEDVKFVSNSESFCLYGGPLQKMSYSILIDEKFAVSLYLRGVKVSTALRIHILRRKSQLVELVREIKQKFADIINLRGAMVDFNDRQNALIVTDKFGRRYNAKDLQFALDIVSISRSAYLRMRSHIALPSIRLLQNTFSSSKKVHVSSILSELSPMQRYIQLIIDEVYVRQSVRFSGGQLFGYACDCPNELAKTILVIYAKCDYGGPSFVVSSKPVFRLTASFQQDAVLNAITDIEDTGCQVVSCTFDGNTINTRMVSTLPLLDQNKPYLTRMNNHPIFWLNDSVHLFKCIRNNFLSAKELNFFPPGSDVMKTAKWSDIVDLQEEDAKLSKSLRTSRLNELSINPPPISRQRVDLAIRVFCSETVAALRLSGRMVTAEFVEHVSNYFNIMNTKFRNSGKFLRDPLRFPITCTSSPAINFLKNFKTMVDRMKPVSAHRKPFEKTLTMNTAVALSTSISGYIEFSEYLLANGFRYVLLGRYSSDPIERLFGKWRQSAGGNFFISVREVYEAERIDWAKLVNRFQGREFITTTSSHSCSLCLSEPDKIDDIVQCNKNNHQLLATCGYIAGYLCKKFPLLPTYTGEIENQSSLQLIQLLNRGGLKYPGGSVINFVLNCNNLFEQLDPAKKSCRNFLIQCFELLDDIHDTKICSERVFRTVANIFQNNFSHIETSQHIDKRKIAKLSQ